MRELAQRSGALQPLWAPWADTAMEAFLRARMLDDCRALVDHLEQVSSGWACRWPRSVAASGRAGDRRGDRRPGRGGTPAPPGCRAAGGHRPPAPPRSALVHYGALSPPQRPSGARPGAPRPSAQGVRGLRRDAPGLAGQGRAPGQRGPAPAGELGPVEPPRAAYRPARRPRCHKRRDSLPPVHFGQDGRAPLDICVRQARGTSRAARAQRALPASRREAAPGPTRRSRVPGAWGTEPSRAGTIKGLSTSGLNKALQPPGTR